MVAEVTSVITAVLNVMKHEEMNLLWVTRAEYIVPEFVKECSGVIEAQ